MSNCHVREVSNLYRALFKDARYAYPTLGTEFERDLNRLLRLAQQRGISVFVTDLPAAGKHLDRCLADGSYKLSGLPLTKRFSNRVVIPKFLRGLYLRVFDESGTLKEDCDVTAVFFLRQLLYAGKKAEIECPSSRIRGEIRAFRELDGALPLPELFWRDEGSINPVVSGLCGLGRQGQRSLDERVPVSWPHADRPFSDPGRDCGDRHELSSSVRPTTLPDRLERNDVLGQEEIPESALYSAPRDSLLPGRRAQVEGSEKDEEVGYEGFSKSSRYVSRLDSRSSREREELTILLGKLDFVSGLLTSTLGPYGPSEWRFRHGPGAISERTGPTNKYSWENWSTSLESEFPIADYGFHSFSSWAYKSDLASSVGSHEPHSRMVAVPKTYTKPRLIAAEPCSKQWCQQNLWHYFRERTHRTWIYRFVRFNDQTRNQRLCIAGSRTGQLGTVDLSTASDLVTCHFVGQFFRKNPKVLRCLRACRTHHVKQTLAQDVPELIDLRKFSTMGNACTFPVETLAFLAIAIASVLTTRRRPNSVREVTRLSREVAVFGDDVIVPVDSRELFEAALEVLDFKVNVSKTFWTGRFRESCGVDSFRGMNVTPAYWKRAFDGTPESIASVLECSNNFYQRFLLNTSGYLASTIPAGFPQVSYNSGITGLKTRTDPVNKGFNTRINKDLQRPEILVRTLSAAQPRLPTNDDTAILQFFTENPDPGEPWTHGVPQRPKLRSKLKWVSLHDVVTNYKA